MPNKTSDDVMEEFEAFVDGLSTDLAPAVRNHLLALVERIQYLAMEEGKENGLEEAYRKCRDPYADGSW